MRVKIDLYCISILINNIFCNPEFVLVLVLNVDKMLCFFVPVEIGTLESSPLIRDTHLFARCKINIKSYSPLPPPPGQRLPRFDLGSRSTSQITENSTMFSQSSSERSAEPFPSVCPLRAGCNKLLWVNTVKGLYRCRTSISLASGLLNMTRFRVNILRLKF